MSAQSPQQELWYIRIVQGPMTGQVFPLQRNPVIIGRDESCDVVISVPGVSRRHAQLGYQEQWFSIQDLGSTNGTFINSARISGAQVFQPGDMISLGTEVTFVLEWGGAAQSSAGVGQLTMPQYTAVAAPPAGAAAAATKSGSGWLWPLVGCGVLALLGLIAVLLVALVLTNVIPNPFAAKTPTATATLVITPTETATLVELSTPTPTPTETFLPAQTPTQTLTPEAPATPTETSTPEQQVTPEATATAEPTATETPPPTSTIKPTDTVAPPTPTPTQTQPPPTATATITPTPAPLAINWELIEKKCISKSQWTMKFRLTVSGGKGQYTYFRDIDQIYGPTNETQYVYELTYGATASAVGTFFVESGGQRAENKFWVDHPDCTTYTP